MGQVDRREFLKTVGVGGAALLCGSGEFSFGGQEQRPDIIYIYTDQQSASMMSCAGNKWLKTPGMDYIAENGIRFERAYSPNPVCSPARVSMVTGRFSGYFNDKNNKQVRENGGAMRIGEVSDEVRKTTIAAYLKKAGYELVFGGKEHLPKSLNPQTLGFKNISKNQRGGLASAAANYIKGKHDKPYFMIVSLINPHDICFMALRDHSIATSKKNVYGGRVDCNTMEKALEMPEGVSEKEFFEKHCRPAPENFEPQKDEPKAIGALLDQRKFKRYARENYTEKDWRRHRWAYCRLTEYVDEHVQTILDAIKQSGREKNTLVIFSSDHGDMDSAHRMEHKTALYEESANIPFMAMWKGHIPAGRVDKESLVSNGLDLLPTVCDYAGIKGKADPRGRSLRPLFEGKKVRWRDTLGVESEIGRMVVNKDGLKLIKYDFAGDEEQLLDLKKDPKETTHFTNDPEYASRLAKIRKSFETEWFKP